MDIHEAVEEAAHLKRIGEGAAALETLKIATDELEEQALVKIHPYHRRRALITTRTRFFIKYAKRHEIRLSALLFVVCAHTRRSWIQGRRGRKAGWHQTAEWFGNQIGVSPKQIYRLVAQGKKLHLIDYARSRRGLLVWVVEGNLFREFKRGDKGWGDDHEFVLGHYYRKLAKLLGLNGSVIYTFLRQAETGDDCEFIRFRKASAEEIHFSLPWMTLKACQHEVAKLERFGVIQREVQGCHFVYFWKPRRLEEHRKWLSTILAETSK